MSPQADKLSIFTREAQSSLVLAQQEAQRRGVSSIEPEHLLWGLLANPTSTACAVLTALNVELAAVRTAVDATLDTQQTRQQSEQATTEISLSPRAKQVIRLAAVEMQQMHHRDIATGHILLGILHDNAGSALLNTFGVSLESARATLSRLCREMVSQPATNLTTSATTTPASPILSEHVRSATVQLDATRQQQIVTLARRRQRFVVLYTIIIAVLIISIGILAEGSGWLLNIWYEMTGAPLLNWQPIAGWPPLLVLLMCIVSSVLLLVISVPLTWYINIVLPYRLGMRRKTPRAWRSLFSKNLLFVLVQLWLLVEVIVLMRAVQPQAWWAWTALLQFLYSILLARFGPIWVQPLINTIEPLPEGDIAGRIRALMERLHVPPCGLYVIKISQRSSAANAHFSGWGNARRILLTDTMLQRFTPAEIEVIAAHELGHFLHHDIWTRLAMRSLQFLAYFLLIDTYGIMLAALNTPTPTPAILFQTASPLIALIALSVLTNLIMRYRRYQEYQADEFALQATGNVQAFKDAMTRLTNMNMLVATSQKGARHPASHPALLKRLKHADEFAARQATTLTQVNV